jgi:hypothetical protein
MAGTKIVAAVAIFGILVVFSVAIVMNITEPAPRHDENLWFKITPRENVSVPSMLATVYVYSVNYTLLEQFLLLNRTVWQSNEIQYPVGKNVLLFIDFWDLNISITDVLFKIGVSFMTTHSFAEIELNIISDWSEPEF